jgi:hypothetical protein
LCCCNQDKTTHRVQHLCQFHNTYLLKGCVRKYEKYILNVEWDWRANNMLYVQWLNIVVNEACAKHADWTHTRE